MKHRGIALRTALSVALLLFVSLLLSACGDTSAPPSTRLPDVGDGSGDVTPPDEPPVAFASNPYPARFTIREGDYLEYAWEQRRTRGYSSGRYRLTFGAPVIVEGYTLHRVEIDHAESGSSPLGVPRWQYLGVHEGIVLGSMTGSDVSVVFWPDALGYHGPLPLNRGIFFQRTQGFPSVSSGSAAGYNLLGFDYVSTYGLWQSPPKCQIIAGVQVCDHYASQTTEETWESVSRDFFATRFSIQKTTMCCGTFPTRSTLVEDVWLHDTSLARRPATIRFEPDTIDYDVAAVSGSVAVLNDTDVALVVRPLNFIAAERGDVPGSTNGLKMSVVDWNPTVPARGSNVFQLDIDRSSLPVEGTYHLLVTFEVDGTDERQYLRLRIDGKP